MTQPPDDEWMDELPEWKDEDHPSYYDKMSAAQFAAMLENDAAYAKSQGIQGRQG